MPVCVRRRSFHFSSGRRCSLASLLTVALHGNLSYLTEVMEVLLKALMQQSGSAQPKLLLRRTESTVEKLLTNWMSICLYGFLRVGSIFFCDNMSPKVTGHVGSTEASAVQPL